MLMSSLIKTFEDLVNMLYLSTKINISNVSRLKWFNNDLRNMRDKVAIVRTINGK